MKKVATSGQIVGATAVAIALVACNQAHQARQLDDESAALAHIRQWQAEAAVLPAKARGRYLAERMAGLLADDALNTCPPRR